jgi:hypothetical protein
MIKGKWMTSVLAVTATVTVGLWPPAGTVPDMKVSAAGPSLTPVSERKRCMSCTHRREEVPSDS